MLRSKLVEKGKIELYREPDIESASDGEVLIRVKAVGICGTDAHIFKGHRDDVALPRTLGHEMSGEVVKVGAGVSHVKPGDHVVVDPVVACGKCGVCKSGHENVCQSVACLGVQCEGVLCELFAAKASQVYKLSPTVPFEKAALAEPFSIGVNICDRLNVQQGDKVVLFGAGTIGLCTLQVLVNRGASTLIADIEDSKLEYALKLGASVAVNSARQDLDAEYAKFCPEGAGIVIDAVGSRALFEKSVQLAAPAGKVAVISFDGEPAAIKPVLITKKELTIVGSRMNNHKFPEVIALLESGALELDGMISAVYSIEDAQKAFEYTIANSATNIKTIIRL